MHRLAVLLVFVATLCFAIGVTQPLLAIERFWLLSETPSLIGIVAGLWTGGDYLLAALIALFSIIFPTVKLALLALSAADPAGREPPAWAKALSKWSMLDVVLVALVIFAAKTSGLATALTLPSLWLFALSVALTAIASALLAKRGD